MVKKNQSPQQNPPQGAAQRTRAAPSKAKGPKQPRQNKTASGRTVSLSQCAADYGKCQTNPWTGPLACVPDFPALFSSKQRVWAKGTLSTGTSGFGFIVVSPPSGAVSDLLSVYNSSSTYAGNTVALTGTGVVGGSTNSMFLSADINNTAAGAQYRVVGAGIRIRYMGTELNRGGFSIGLHDPSHTTMDGRSIVGMRAEMVAVEFATSRKWQNVLYRPVYNDELLYNGVITPNPFMGFVIQSPDASILSTYEYEFSAVYEYQGRNVRSMTVSHTDPVGFAAVNAVSLNNPSMRPNDLPPEHRETQTIKSIANYVDRGVSGVTAGIASAKQVAQTGQKVLSAGANWWNDIEEIFSIAAPLLLMI